MGSSSMKWSRRLRKELTIRTLQLGGRFAQKGDEKTIETIRGWMRGFFRVALPLRNMLKTNMRHAGVEPDAVVDAYFERAIDQMVMLANILRVGLPKSGCLERFKFDESLGILKQVYSRGKGAICIAPHISGYPLLGGIISPKVPCAIYMRNNKDQRKMQISEAIAKAGDQELIYPPKGEAKGVRLKVAIDALREGKVMFLTSDTPRKPHEGVAVRIFGKRTYFPTGTYVMSLRTGAPIVPTWWYWKDGGYHITFSEPIELQRGGGLQAKMEAAVQKWATDVDGFLHEYPEMWWNWLDKRWTRILRNGSVDY